MVVLTYKPTYIILNYWIWLCCCIKKSDKKQKKKEVTCRLLSCGAEGRMEIWLHLHSASLSHVATALKPEKLVKDTTAGETFSYITRLDFIYHGCMELGLE